MVFTDYKLALDFLESQSAYGNLDAIKDINIDNEAEVIGRANQIGLNVAEGVAPYDQEQAFEGQEESVEQIQDMMGNTAKVKSFNLKKAQVFPEATLTDPFGAESTPEGLKLEQDYMASQDPENTLQWESPESLGDYLSNYESIHDLSMRSPELLSALSENEQARGALQRWFESDNSETKSTYQTLIYHALPEDMKNQEPGDMEGQNIPVQDTEFGDTAFSEEITRIITSSSDEIKKEVKKVIKKRSAKKFNLSKTAQHKTDQNVIMWGPGEKRPDPFLRGQPVSDWHIMERNKGFGRDIDGYWGVDWEAVWRGSIMDKYSRPYRDSKTGDWIGGYIQKRFEVDKSIPEGRNNYQLLPGERRKAYLPEYAGTEARLQAMRNKNDGNLGRVFNNTSEPFNWREAKSQTTIKQSSTLDSSLAAKLEKSAKKKII
jgi:hypothetical protein